MTFSRDIKNYQYRTPRSLNDAFGPYSRWNVKRDSQAKQWAYAISTGLVIGFFWWLGVALRAGAA